MQTKALYNLRGACIIAAFCSLAACNDSDNKTSANGSMSSDSSAKSSMAATDTAVADSSKDKMATTVTPVTRKKRKTSITFPPANAEKMMKDKDGVYNNAEVMPEFPGGQDALGVYVNDHLQYPQSAIDDNTTGTVKVSFVVDEKGKVSMAHLVDGGKVGNGLDEEAVKVINRMPSWKPGKVKGKNVKTRMELPISFQVEA
ncbi:MAG TPA: energy transducer TonB [Puia sp.]|nr:energy transducer TonB [Puia sp.]